MKTKAVATMVATLALATSASVEARTVDSATGPIAVENRASGLAHPWGMAFLPDGRLLVTERPGRLRILKAGGDLSPPVGGTPEVFDRGQGGLLDVAVSPKFSQNRRVYLAFAEPGSSAKASTALGRGRLVDGRIEGFEVIFRQQPKVEGANHFGGRIAFSPQGHLFLTMGERYAFDPAQNPANHLGTIVRLQPDGSPVAGNPFVDDPDARNSIWSLGHRNIESAAIHPQTGQLWIAEMGPSGGDELNRPQPGRNYGWPVVSWGEHYSGADIPNPPTHAKFADALRHWTPVISPSGMAFYTGSLFSEWQGDLLIGGLSAHALVRLELDGSTIAGETRIQLDARIRDVEQGPQGAVYVLTDQSNGNVWRLTPAEN